MSQERKTGLWGAGRSQLFVLYPGQCGQLGWRPKCTRRGCGARGEGLEEWETRERGDRSGSCCNSGGNRLNDLTRAVAVEWGGAVALDG